jgi:hypothetical protein
MKCLKNIKIIDKIKDKMNMNMSKKEILKLPIKLNITEKEKLPKEFPINLIL